MALSQADTARLYSDAFQTNTKTMAGENAFVICDLKTNLDVANMRAGVLQDELDATQKELESVKIERDDFKAKWEGSTEGKDAALQASADETAGRSA